MSFLEITEEWIKDRVKISNEKLDDIKSLSLPGTYDEKIFKLGTSLIHFTRLKELDLSRNVLESLEGMEHLRCLESLNLYYNNIGSLKELYRLRGNSSLAQLDLRLNPVARNEADYRLCLIHMLPLLIRLDDRCVKDQERKAALMYFGSDQSKEFSADFVTSREDTNRSSLVLPMKKTNARVEMVNRWTKGIVKDDFFESDNFHLDLKDVDNEDTNVMTAPRSKDHRSAKEYSTRGANNFYNKRLSVEREFTVEKPPSFTMCKAKTNVSTIPVYVRQDEPFMDNENYTKAHGDDFGLSNLSERPNGDYRTNNPPSILNKNKYDYSKETEKEFIVPREVTDKICDLVDRHWNGSRSLHQNQKFIVGVSRIMESLSIKPHENEFAQSEINYLKENICKLEEENLHLKRNIAETKSSDRNDRDNVSVIDIKSTNRALKEEIRELRRKLDASEKISEITDLLKESHDSLITTNEQLKKQLAVQNRLFK